MEFTASASRECRFPACRCRAAEEANRQETCPATHGGISVFLASAATNWRFDQGPDQSREGGF